MNVWLRTPSLSEVLQAWDDCEHQEDFGSFEAFCRYIEAIL
jgi:hypothetical protein